MIKNAMNLIDHVRSEEIDKLINNATIVIGGSAANTAACLSKFNCLSNFIEELVHLYGVNYRNNLNKQLVKTHLINDQNIQLHAHIYLWTLRRKNYEYSPGASINLQPNDIPEFNSICDIIYVKVSWLRRSKCWEN